MAVPPGNVWIEVVDVDLPVNETIGKGTCSRGRTCKLALATVTIH
jgi:hypothetical protein